MTTTEIAEYYSGLLIMQYNGLPKASATIEALVTPAIYDQMPIAVQNAFNLDGSAVGVQLDVIGKYVGVSRTGIDLNGNSIVLDDADFLQLIKLVIIKNNSGSSLATIQGLLSAAFPDQIFISDSTTMQIGYVIIRTIGTSNLLSLLATGGYLPRPMGVQISVTIIDASPNPFFGFRTYSTPATGFSPFNNYTIYLTTYPWFSYKDAV